MKPFKLHKGWKADCVACRKSAGLAPKVVKQPYKKKYYSAYKPLTPVPEAQPEVQPQQASLDATGEVTLY